MQLRRLTTVVALASGACGFAPLLGRPGILRRAPTALGSSVSIEGLDSAALVGAPRVARYLRDEGSEYVMWFEARSDNLDARLPLGSSGRIWRARSADGVKFEVTDEKPCLDLCEDWYAFDTSHVGLGDVVLGNNEKILTDAGVYMMYYAGGDFNDDDDVMASKLGARTHIGTAVSQDGQHWSRIEGEHATGAALEPTGDETRVAFPHVVQQPASAKAQWRMYYSAKTVSDPKRWVLKFAESQDGIRWAKAGSVPMGGAGAHFQGGVARPYVVEDGGRQVMFFEGRAEAGGRSIGRAVSEDAGATWAADDAPVVSAAAAAAAWDSGGVGSPHVLQVGDDGWRMYYQGWSADGGGQKIGIAEAGALDGEWEKL